MSLIICPCCGQTQVDDYDICDICGWENDPVQRNKPEYRGGANGMSLIEAREAYNAGARFQ